jgi:isopenicillin N synthase-like dioxygenase
MFAKISRNNILSLTSAPFPRPLPVEEYLPNLEQLTLGCMDISQTIFRILSEALSLPSGGAFESFHRHSHPSPDVIRLLKYAAHQSDAPCVPQTAHTDLGSLTFLFTRSPGLQVQREVGEEWMYVLPKEGHAVVNLGDAMTLFTDGLFRSCLHRVASMPGQAMQERYSFAFLMRPEDTTLMRPLNSPLIQPHVSPREPITCRDWIARKFVILRSKADNANESRILTGRS